MELLPLLVVAPWHVFNSPSGIIHFHCLTAVQFRLPISYKQFQLFFSSPFATFEIMQLIARNPEHLTPKKMCSFAFLIPSCLSAGKCIINLTFARQKGRSGGQAGRVGTGVRGTGSRNCSYTTRNFIIIFLVLNARMGSSTSLVLPFTSHIMFFIRNAIKRIPLKILLTNWIPECRSSLGSQKQNKILRNKKLNQPLWQAIIVMSLGISGIS